MADSLTELLGPLVIVDGDLEREFEARLAETGTLAFRVAFAVLRHRENAEDVAQASLIKAHRKFSQLRDPALFRAWMVRMTWRLALDRQRAERRRVAREQSPVVIAPLPTPADTLAATERARLLWNAIDALPEKLRLVIVLAGIHEYDIEEVARLLRLPVGTVKSRLFLARRRLREHLQWMIR